MIGDAALPSPNSLVIIVGRTPAQLAHTPNSVQVTSISTTVLGWPLPRPKANPQGLTYIPPDPGGGASAIDLILSVVALAILAPVLIFIATATRLSAARREERFAAMRLAGATRRQVSLLAATESTVAGILGVAAGFGIFFLLRIPVAGIPFIGQPFFPAELSLSLPDILVVAIGVPVFAAVAARLALRRVHISPLGVARRATPKPPRAWRVVPLLAGLAELGFWTVHGHPASIPGQIQAFVSSFALIIVGLFIAGPWLTMAAARAMARWTSRPGTLIAARRLADDPRAAFRAVSGLVLALFITTVAVVAITTQDAKNLTRWGSAAEANVLTDQVSASSQAAGSSGPGASQGTAPRGRPRPPRRSTARLRGIPGVQGVLVVRADPRLTIPGTFHDLGANQGSTGPVPAGVVSCAQLATVPALGRCPAGATAAAFPADGFNGPLFGTDTTTITWPAANVPASRLDTLGVDAINVATDGTTPAVEQARTLLENAHAYPAVSTPSTIGDIVAQDNSKQQRLPAARERGDPGQPADRRLHARRGHRGRARRPQAAVQPAAAHRRPARHAAPRRRAGRRRPAARRRRRRDRHRVRRRRDVRHRGAAAPDGRARRRVLPAHRGRDRGVPRHHRGHLPAAGTHHRTRGRQKRMNPRISTSPPNRFLLRAGRVPREDPAAAFAGCSPLP